MTDEPVPSHTKSHVNTTDLFRRAQSFVVLQSVEDQGISSTNPCKARECVSLQPLPESPERHNPESPERHNVEKREFSPAEDPAASEDIESEIVIVENCTTRYKHIQLGDKEEVTRYYESLIRLIGQLSLKKILKAWIREIQPRKQAENPYNGGKYKSLSIKMYGDDNLGAMTAPSWWPPCFQRKDKARCRHREPDHQIKPGQ